MAHSTLTAITPGRALTLNDLGLFSNSLGSPLTADIGTGSLLIPVQDLADYNDKGVVVIDSERIFYTSKSAASGAGNLVVPDTDHRGWDGSTAAAHTTGATVSPWLTAYPLNRIMTELVALSESLQGQLTATTFTNPTINGTVTTTGLTMPTFGMGTARITGLGDPVDAQDAATKNWVETSFTADHGGLSGLADDDHTQYPLVSGARGFTDAFPLTEIGSDPTAPSAGTTKVYAKTAGLFYRNSSGIVQLGDVRLTATQTLTGKTIDGASNTLLNLNHGVEVDNPSSGVHGVVGDVVGTTDTQTLTNKTLTSARHTDAMDWNELTSDPATLPTAGRWHLYFKSDGLHYRDDAGNVTGPLGAGGGGGTGEANTASNLGTGQGVFFAKSGVDLQFKSLKSGGDLSISSTSNDITYSYTAAATNLGVGTGLFVQNNAGSLEFKSLKVAGSLAIANDATSVTISFTETGEANTLTSVGSGTSLVAGKVGVDLQVKSLLAAAGSNLAYTADADEVTLDWTGVTVRKNSDVSNIGSRPRINLIEGNGITLTVADDATDDEIDITITNASPGESNTASNLGTGTGIFLQKTGVDFEFKSLKVAGSLAIANDATSVTISFTETGEANTISSLGAGTSLVSGKVGVDLQLKGLAASAGSNLALSATSDTVSVDWTGVTVRKNTGGVDVGTRPRLNLIEGTGVTITTADDATDDELDITIASTTTASNLGTGTGLFAQKTDATIELKSLKVSGSLGISDDATSVTISFTETGQANTASNVGSGTGLFKAKSGVDLQFKSLVEGSGISLTSGTNDVTIAFSGKAALSWTEVTGTSQTMAVGNAYIANNASRVTLTLPSSAAVGDRVMVVGKGAGGWKVAQNASQQIHYGQFSTTSGTTGNLTSTHQYDVVELVCVTANTTWVVVAGIGTVEET